MVSLAGRINAKCKLRHAMIPHFKQKSKSKVSVGFYANYAQGLEWCVASYPTVSCRVTTSPATRFSARCTLARIGTM